MREKVYEILKLGLALIFFFCFGEVAILILKIFHINMESVGIRGEAIYQFIMSFILFVVYLVLYFKNIKKDFVKFKSKLNKNIFYIIKMFFIFMAVKFLSSLVSAFIIIVLKMDTSSITSVNQSLIESFIRTSPFLMLFSTSLFAPFYEEILFRLGLGRVINNKCLFIIISGFVFGLMHIFPLGEGVTLTLGLIQSISYVVMGMFLAYIYKKQDNIFASIGLHFLNNFLSVLVMINMY